MFDLPPILKAATTGLVSGLLLSIPVGPINLTIMNEGARRGFHWALLIGLGATTMEVIYCTVAFTGFAGFILQGWVKSGLEVFSFGFLLFLGIKFLTAKNVAAPMHISAAADRLEERLEQKLHPHSAFMTGVIRVAGNVGVLLFWIILAANFMSRGWVQPTAEGKLACLVGVAVGTGAWFTGLSWAVSLGHGNFSERNLLRMERLSGVVLLALALGHGGHLAWQLARHRM